MQLCCKPPATCCSTAAPVPMLKAQRKVHLRTHNTRAHQCLQQCPAVLLGWAVCMCPAVLLGWVVLAGHPDSVQQLLLLPAASCSTKAGAATRPIRHHTSCPTKTQPSLAASPVVRQLNNLQLRLRH